VDTHVRRLREKLGAEGESIETVRSFGYRLVDPAAMGRHAERISAGAAAG
jgi:DNA-binding winged helix-turn-helix (wHTH) protein